MPTFEIHASGERLETVELDMSTIASVIKMVEAFWTDAVFRNEGGSPFTAAVVKCGGRTMASGWLEPAGWMWDDIDSSFDER